MIETQHWFLERVLDCHDLDSYGVEVPLYAFAFWGPEDGGETFSWAYIINSSETPPSSFFRQLKKSTDITPWILA